MREKSLITVKCGLSWPLSRLDSNATFSLKHGRGQKKRTLVLSNVPRINVEERDEGLK
jgi:hypothetical protein